MSRPSRETGPPSPQTTRTQEIASRYVRDADNPSAAEVRALIHALEVHEMELLAQNDQLQATRQDLERAHNRYLELYETAPEGYLTLDADGCIIEGNPAAAALLGADRNVWAGTPLSASIAAMDVSALCDHLARCRGAADKVVTELTLAGRKGRPAILVGLTSRWLPGGEGQLPLYRTNLLDVSDRRRVEDILRLEKNRLASILDSMDDAAYIANEQWALEYANPAMIREFGSLVGHKCFQALAGRDKPCDSCCESGILHGQQARREWKCERLGKTFEAIATPLQNANGTLSRLGMLRDVTKRKQADQALAKTSAELARSNRDLQQFADVASHDLQAPLRMVTGFLALLKERCAPKLDDSAREFIGFAVDGATRMNRLIHDLLAFARVGSKGGEFLPVEMAQVLDHVLRDRMAAIKESDALITSDPMPNVMADEGQIGQVLSNLFGNAIKYRAKDRRLEIHVSVRHEGEAWVIGVGDNGIGFDPKDAERVFEIFQRLHGQDEYDGTGIGLAICKRIVERHGGRIWVESQPGQGATFFFTIPDRA